MKVILRALLVTDWGEVTEVDVAEFSRPARALNANTLGLSLTDGKGLLQRLQQTIAGAQAEELCELHRICQRCHRRNPAKTTDHARSTRYLARSASEVRGSSRVTASLRFTLSCQYPR
jgi:hypothetical protein